LLVASGGSRAWARPTCPVAGSHCFERRRVRRGARPRAVFCGGHAVQRGCHHRRKMGRCCRWPVDPNGARW